MNLEKMLELTIAGREDVAKSLELENLIKKYIAEEIASKKGGNKEKNRLKAAERYLKESAKTHTNKALHGSWVVNGKQYMTNTYSGVELVGDSILEGLTELEEDVQPLKLADTIEMGRRSADTKQPNPDLTALKTQLTEAKAEAKANKVKLIAVDKAFTKIGEAHYSIDLLLKTIAILPGELEYYNSKELSPLIVTDDKGNYAIVMPVKR